MFCWVKVERLNPVLCGLQMVDFCVSTLEFCILGILGSESIRNPPLSSVSLSFTNSSRDSPRLELEAFGGFAMRKMWGIWRGDVNNLGKILEDPGKCWKNTEKIWNSTHPWNCFCGAFKKPFQHFNLSIPNWTRNGSMTWAGSSVVPFSQA